MHKNKESMSLSDKGKILKTIKTLKSSSGRGSLRRNIAIVGLILFTEIFCGACSENAETSESADERISFQSREYSESEPEEVRACKTIAAEQADGEDLPFPETPGIVPYEFTEREKYLLSAMGFDRNVKIFLIRTPEDTEKIRVRYYELKDGGKWEEEPLGTAVDVSSRMNKETTGSLTVIRDHEVRSEVFVNLTFPSFTSTLRTEAATIPENLSFNLSEYAEGFIPAEKGGEIPIIIKAYATSKGIGRFSLDDFYNPEKFEDAEFAYAYTLCFE